MYNYASIWKNLKGQEKAVLQIRSQERGNYAKNREKAQAQVKARYHANPSPKMTATKQHYASNREDMCLDGTNMCCLNQSLLQEMLTW